MRRFYDFMIERETIRIKKADGLSAPWTDDPILHKYKFTNVHREHDKTSRLLIEEFYEPHKDDPDVVILLNCAIARYFGTIEFMRAVEWQTEFKPDYLKYFARARLDTKQRVFTGAYVITNQGISAPKYEVVVDNFLRPLWANAGALCDWTSGSQKWEDLIKLMQKLPGFGGSGFMAKEVILDTTYTNFWKHGLPSDWNTWCPAGPGAQRGLRRLTGLTELAAIRKPMKLEQALPMMLSLYDERKTRWPARFPDLCLHDIQFQLCEFDKYERVRLGQGTPRSRYHHADNNSNP